MTEFHKEKEGRRSYLLLYFKFRDTRYAPVFISPLPNYDLVFSFDMFTYK
jgi:hypothetical protein